jgi:peptide/nickel transport system substrate-binding protein
VNQSVTQVYNVVYQQVPDLWLYGINPYWVQRTYVSGIIYNPGILGFYYPLVYYSSS